MHGRVVLITGASSGIGLATSERFAAAGDHVYNLDLVQPARPIDGVTHVEVDVTDWDALHAAADRIAAEHGGVDVAIANAGISRRTPFEDLTAVQLRQVLEVNVIGVFNLWNSVIPHCQHGPERGVLLATASTNASAGYPFYADYNASKAAVLALTRTVALEFAATVRTACVSPGYVMTPMQRAEYTDEMLEETNARIPMQRHAEPEEVAEVFHFLSSGGARYITGQQIVLDGGELAGGTASRFIVDRSDPTRADR